MSQSPTLMNWLALVILGIIWGAAFLAAKFALISFEPMTIATIRIGFGAAILLLFCRITGRKLPRFNDPNGPRIWLHMAIFGILTNALPFSLLNWGQNYVTSGFAGVTMALVPLFTLPLAHLMIATERMSLMKTLGFIIGFIGIIILIEPNQISQTTGSDWEPIARMACITASLCYACGSLNTRLCPPVSTLAYSAGGLLLGFLMIAPISLLLEGIPNSVSPQAVSAVLYLAIFPTALATILLVWVINTAGPTFLTTVNYQVPIWAVIFGVIFLNETVPASFSIAAVFIFAGLGLAQIRRSPRQ